MPDTSDRNTVYPKFGKQFGAGGRGSEPPSPDLFLKLVDTKIEAGEERVMRYLSEKTSSLEKELSRQMSEVVSTVHKIKPGASWPQISGIAFITLTAAFAILAYASDRFDGGLSAGALVDAVAERISAEQRDKDDLQDAKLDKILDAIAVLNDQPKTSP